MSDIQFKRETITLNQVNYHIQSLKDNQQYNDDDNASARIGISSSTWPLFGILWPSSIILATTVAHMKLKGKRVLEIGCGLAFSSIVLHRMGIDITASDYHPLAREFLNTNILNNKLPPIQYQTGNWETENSSLGEFDLIIGSDILYLESTDLSLRNKPEKKHSIRVLSFGNEFSEVTVFRVNQ